MPSLSHVLVAVVMFMTAFFSVSAESTNQSSVVSIHQMPTYLSSEVIYGQNLDEQILSAQIQTRRSEASFDKTNYVLGVTKLALLYDIKQFHDSALYFAERALELGGDSCNLLKVRLLGTALRSASILQETDKVKRYLSSLNSCQKESPSLSAEISFQKAQYYLLSHQFPLFASEILLVEYSSQSEVPVDTRAQVHLLKARFFEKVGQAEAAMEAVKLFLASIPNDSSKLMFAYGLQVQSDIYRSTAQWSEAKLGYEKSLQYFLKAGAQGSCAEICVSLVHTSCELNDYLSAESYLFQANALLQAANGSLGNQLPAASRAHARLKMALYKTEAATQIALQALGLSDASGNRLESYYIRDFLATLSEKTGQFDQALTYRKSADNLFKELGMNGAYASYIAGAQTHIASSSALNNTNDLHSPLNKEALNGQTVYFILGALLLLLVVIGFLITRNHVKQKTNRELQKKNEVIVHQNKELLITNEQLNEARLKAEAASVAKSNFLAITSHEIRTPLNGIMGMASLLSETQLDPAQKNYVETIVKSSENLLIILNDILDFSKLESGKVSLEVKLIDLERLLDEVRTIFAKQAQERNITITRKIGNAGIKFFRGDILRIRQVLINLVSNAVKFTENGTVKIIVDLEELNKEGDDEHNRNAILRFSVQDDGIGISPEKQQIIFESFEQEDSSTSRKFGGIGLGLSISKKLVELMGGSIGLQSQKNVGTTFYFSLPVVIPDITNKLNEEPVNAAVREEESAIKDLPISERYPMRILMAEDNMFNKLFIEKLLEKFGYEEFLHAENGHQVMELLNKESVDLILMDIQMPGKDGIETTKEIIAKYGEKRPVIVAVTADSNDSNKEFYLNAGMDAFLSKPFKEKDLRAILEKYGQRVASGKSPFKRIKP